MIAAGTSPNTIIERENPGTFKLDKWNQYFLQHVRVMKMIPFWKKQHQMKLDFLHRTKKMESTFRTMVIIIILCLQGML